MCGRNFEFVMVHFCDLGSQGECHLNHIFTILSAKGLSKSNITDRRKIKLPLERVITTILEKIYKNNHSILYSTTNNENEDRWWLDR